MSNRVILHSDLNCFYASVETMLNPSLRGKAVAVCGATEDRHGIVLAKSEKAKKAGRVGFKFETDKKGNTEKVRVNKKTGAVIKDKK